MLKNKQLLHKTLKRRTKHALVTLLVCLLFCVIRKRRRLYVFINTESLPWGGNTRAVCDALNMHPEAKVKIVNFGVTPTVDIQHLYGSRLEVVDGKDWFRCSFEMARAYMKITENYTYGWLPGKICQLYHGINSKKNDRFAIYSTIKQKLEYWMLVRPLSKVSCSFVASKFEQVSRVATWRTFPDRIMITGLPRTDWLMTEELPEDLQAMEDRVREELAGRRLMLYMPTYRANLLDFKGTTTGINLPMTDGELDRLTAFLGRHGYVLGIRPHLTRDDLSLSSHQDILFFGDKTRYPENGVLLRNAAVLITDYSSICMDYLLLDRPVIGFCHDLAEYERNRGFIYDFETIFPGPVTRDFNEFMVVIEALAMEGGAGKDLPEKRRFVRKLLHAYDDGCAAERVAEHLISL